MDETHLLNEAKQIRLFSEKIKKIITFDYDQIKPMSDVNTTIEDVAQISVTTQNLLEKISKDNTISAELRTKINHELRTPLVPILAYAEMLLDPKFGSLSDEQRKRLEIMRSNIKTLTQTIHDLFNEKNFNIISDKPEKNTSHEIRELIQEKKFQDVINTSLSEELELTRKENKAIKDQLKEDDQKIRENV
jgi:signal transduction histidine kinase